MSCKKNDEFGRDLSLKTKQTNNMICDYLARFKGMSWAEITWLIEEEEEAERRLVEKEKARDQRKKLFQQGLYELEDGEELDI